MKLFLLTISTQYMRFIITVKRNLLFKMYFKVIFKCHEKKQPKSEFLPPKMYSFEYKFQKMFINEGDL